MNRHDEDDPWLTHLSVEGDDGTIRSYKLPNGGAYLSTVHEKLLQYLVQQWRMRSLELGRQELPPRRGFRITPMDVFVFLCLVNMMGLLVHILLGQG